MDTYVYEFHNNIYINLTNACNNNCDFCVRNTMDGVGDDVLWLEKEPSATDVMAQLKNHTISKDTQIVFCGYGEPTMRLDTLIECAKLMKEYCAASIRINTNGLANMLYQKDITPLFAGLIDTISVSLNESNPKDYDRICHSEYGEDAYNELLDFTEKCKAYIPLVKLTIVDILPQEKIDACKEIADRIGVVLRIRKHIV